MDGERHAKMRQMVHEMGYRYPICRVPAYRECGRYQTGDAMGLDDQRQMFRRDQEYVRWQWRAAGGSYQPKRKVRGA